MTISKTNINKIKGVIFDLDGVLIHTDKLHFQAWKRLADSIHVYFDEKINERLRGVSRMASLKIILENAENQFSETEKELLAAEKNETYKELLKTLTPSDVSQDVRQTLKNLREKGLKLAVGSSSKNAKYILSYTELSDALDAVSDGNNIAKSKPDPEVFLKAAEFLGLSPQECLVVEDAEAGIEAAKAGGFTAVGIGSAARDARADYSIIKLSDLEKILENAE